MTDGESLKSGIRAFDQKKRECLALIGRAQEMMEAFAADFPAFVDENSRLNPAFLKAAQAKIQESRLRILVAGQFKTGKSALVNAMLGEAVLPSYSTPCTAVITEIESGDSPGLELLFKLDIDGNNLPIGLDERVAAHIRAAGAEIPPLKLPLASRDELEKFIAIDDSGEDQAQGIAANPVSVCRLRLPLSLCEGEIVIIDSPGLNENGARDRITLERAPEADMILHVLNAQQVYGLPDQQFIQSVRLMGDIPLLFAINRFDLIQSAKERERLRAYALKKLIPHAPYGEAGIFFTSAEQALAGRLAGDPDLLAQSGFLEFEAKIAEIFASERLKIKLGHIRPVIADIGEMATVFLPRAARALVESREGLEKRLAEQSEILKRLDMRLNRIRDLCRARISAFQDKMQAGLEAFFRNFREEDLEAVAQSVDLSGYNVSGDQGKTAATALLIASVEENLREKLGGWQRGEGAARYEEALKDIQAEVESGLDDFNALMRVLEEPWDFDAAGSAHGGLNVSVPAQGFALAGNLAAGGGLAGIAALALLPARFLGEFGGPVGWLVVALTTGLGAALSYWSRSVARENLKESFINESRKLLASHATEWARNISMEAANSLGEQSLLFLGELRKRIDDAKRPAEAAIETLAKSGGEIKDKTLRLEGLIREFGDLRERANDLQRKLE